MWWHFPIMRHLLVIVFSLIKHFHFMLLTLSNIFQIILDKRNITFTFLHHVLLLSSHLCIFFLLPGNFYEHQLVDGIYCLSFESIHFSIPLIYCITFLIYFDIYTYSYLFYFILVWLFFVLTMSIFMKLSVKLFQLLFCFILF